jgi:hypothetical protein
MVVKPNGQAVEKGPFTSLRSNRFASNRARSDFTITFHGHDHDECAPRSWDLFEQPDWNIF